MFYFSDFVGRKIGQIFEIMVKNKILMSDVKNPLTRNFVYDFWKFGDLEMDKRQVVKKNCYFSGWWTQKSNRKMWEKF